MKKSWFAVVLVATVMGLCGPALSFDASIPPAERNAIVFSWDGVQREHQNQCLSRNELPNLAALIAEGKMVNIDISGHATDTKAGHTQTLTGYDPELTGVYSNGNFKPIPEGLTIFERLEKAFGDDNITTIMVTGKTHHIGSCPPSDPEKIKQVEAKLKTLVEQNAPKAQQNKVKKQLNTLRQNKEGEPWYLVHKNFDVWDGDKGRDNTVVGPLMMGYLDKYGKGRFFAYYHFSDPDHTGHAHGENSKEYNDAIIACDMWLGETVKKLKELGAYDRTMVLVTADHGFDEGLKSHRNAPYIALAGNLKTLAKDGDMRDITPTLLMQMGVDISKIEPKYPGVVLTSK